MNWEEYKELSEKTLSTEFHVGAKTENLLHAVMGILTELEELIINHDEEYDGTNVLEEVGDITWYLAIIGREYNMDWDPDEPSQFITPSKSDSIMKMLKSGLRLLDVLKKKIYYNKPMDDQYIIDETRILMRNLVFYMGNDKTTFNSCFAVNIAKLRHRYGDKFTSERAINRDLETERNILESGN
jgi:hypothetical protein